MQPNATAAQQRRRVQARIDNVDAYGFFDLLTGPELLDDVESLLPAHRERLFPPIETLSMFMAQALSADGSCRQVVNDAAVKRLIAGMSPCSSNTAAYCKARARLPQAMIETLTRRTGEVVVGAASDSWLWRKRRVLLVDGTTVSLADPPIPWGEAWSRAIAPDGSAWTVIDRQLYVVTPEAVMVAE